MLNTAEIEICKVLLKAFNSTWEFVFQSYSAKSFIFIFSVLFNKNVKKNLKSLI